VHQLARRLVPDFEIDVLAPHAPGLATEEILDDVRVHRFRYAPERLEKLAYGGGMLSHLSAHPLRWLLVPLFVAALVIAARRLLRRRRHFAIHAHWLLPQGLASLFCRRVAGRYIPVLCTLHGGDLFVLEGALVDELLRLILRRLDSVTVVSEAMRERLRSLGRDLPVDAVVPMGTDLTERFTPDPRIEREPFVLFVGRLVKKKGADLLLEAFARIAADHPDLGLVVAGDGPERAELEALASRLGIPGRIRFLGAVAIDRLPDLYRRATAAAFPFRRTASGDQEGFGLVVVEAMGCGCPVICGDVPAVRDIVSNGVTGQLVPPGDFDALTRALRETLADSDRARRMAEAAGRFVRSHFDWEMSRAAYRKLLMSLSDRS
jgi:glycosyltransferase involved in cell wall biosynthesis